MPDPHLDHYKRAIEGKKREILRLANSVLSLLQGAREPNNKQHFQDACAQLRQAIGQAQGLFDPTAPVAILAQMDNAALQLGRTPENSNYIVQFVDLMRQIPNIPYDRESLEDEVKKLVDDKELQEKIDQLRDELTRLVKECGDDLQYRLMTEIQRLGDVLLGVRKKSLLEVLATTDGIAGIVGAAVDFGTSTPVGTILSSISRIALEIRSSARDKLDDRLRSYLDDLNVRMPMRKSILDRSDSPPELPE